MSGSDGIEAVSNETWLQFLREAALTKRAIEEATGKHRAVLKRAKANGCNPKVISLALQAKHSAPELVVNEIKDTVRVLNISRTVSISQEDLFGGWELGVVLTAQHSQTLFDAQEAGYRAGKHGTPLDDCPHDPGTEMHVEWTKGWRAGQNAIAKEMGPNAKPANASKKRPARAAQSAKPKATTRRTGPRRSRGDAAAAPPLM